MALTDRERGVLDIEGQFWKYAGVKEQAIGRLGLTATRHYQVLNTLLGRADAWEYAPTVLARVQRVRDGQGHRSRALAAGSEGET